MWRFWIAIGTIGSFFVLGLLFLWYAHASIYHNLGRSGLSAPSDFTAYTLGEALDTSLTYDAIGDSLTAGVGVLSYTESYPYLLALNIASDTQAQVTLRPYAVPGIRSAFALEHFIDPVIADDPDIVTVFLGINDIHGNVPPEVFKENYAEILARLSQETDAKIYAINLPYIGTRELIDLPFRHYFNWRTTQYNAVIAEVARTYDATYIDLYSSHYPNAFDTAYYAADFFHPNALGYTVWAHAIYANFSH